MLDAARANYAAQRALSASTVKEVLRLWAQVDPDHLDASYDALLVQILTRVTGSQLLAAHLAAEYVPRVLLEQNLDPAADVTLHPQAFTGVASDGRDLAGLLIGPLISVKIAIAAGQGVTDAMRSGRESLARMAATQVADAGRAAESVATAVRPAANAWVRMLVLPSCSRCAILAGRVYRWSSGFRRHPMCDCRHIPTAEAVAQDLTLDPRAAIESGQVHGLSNADRQAVLDGADPAKVVNAQRGMFTASAFGRQLSSTREGTTRRGQFGKAELTAGRGGRSPRLRPEEIYRQADGDRTEVVRLLRRFGYVL